MPRPPGVAALVKVQPEVRGRLSGRAVLVDPPADRAQLARTQLGKVVRLGRAQLVEVLLGRAPPLGKVVRLGRARLVEVLVGRVVRLGWRRLARRRLRTAVGLSTVGSVGLRPGWAVPVGLPLG
ncbi:MAG TPA: hypothetical protein VGL05_16790 [Kribbella sp.]